MKLPEPAERPWLTVAELAEITGEGEKAIRAALDAGHLPLLRVGRYVRIPTARLRQVLGIDPSATPQLPAHPAAAPVGLRRISGL